MCFVISRMLWHSYFQYVQWLHVVKMFDVSQVVEAWCIFRMFCEKCNKIYLDKVLIFCFSEIMGWEVIVAHQEPSTPKCDGTCGDHARITRRARVIRATIRMVCQSSIYLPSRNIFQQRVPWRLYGSRHTHYPLLSWISRRLFLLLSVSRTTWQVDLPRSSSWKHQGLNSEEASLSPWTFSMQYKF